MLRNKDSWELAEPEMNNKGQLVIHDIASKLGCIRSSPELAHSFPERRSDFTALRARLRLAESEEWPETMDGNRRISSEGSPTLEGSQRASSAESEHSQYQQFFSSSPQKPQYQQGQNTIPGSNHQPIENKLNKFTSKDMLGKSASVDTHSYDSRTTFDTLSSISSPVYTDVNANSLLFSSVLPFTAWSCDDDFLRQQHALDLVAQHDMCQSQAQYNILSIPNSLNAPYFAVDHVSR